MTVELTHGEVMHVARLSGELIGTVFGRPSLVIGVARSGTEIAAQLAAGADPDATIRVHLSRPSSSGGGAWARRIWTSGAPAKLRRTYKDLLFRSMARLSSVVDPPPIDALELVQLERALSEDDTLVVIVDDAIDSGRTAASVVATVRAKAPDATVVMFAVGSTLGRTVADHQLTIWSGSVVHLTEGDLALLDDPSRLDPPDRVPAGRRRRESAPVDRIELASQRQLYLDLDGTMTRDSFKDAARLMLSQLLATRRWSRAMRFALLRLAKKGRLVGHEHLKRALDREIRALPVDDRREFDRLLANRLTASARPALQAIGNAPNVRCSVVTAALASYVPAIESAFGFPVLGGSGPDEHGTWAEVGSQDKLAAIQKDRAQCGSGPSLLIGDTITDGLTAAADLTVVSIPGWDRTGLMTVLGVPTWWRGVAQ